MPVRNTQPSNLPQTTPVLTFRARLVAGVILLNLLVAGICWYSLHQSRIYAAERAVLTTQNMAKVLDENMTGIVAKVDIAMLAVVDEAERQLAAGGIRQAVLTDFIVREHSRLPEVEVFRATEASGDAVYGPQATAATTTSLAHRDYFRQLKGDPGAGLVLSKPLVGGAGAATNLAPDAQSRTKQSKAPRRIKNLNRPSWVSGCGALGPGRGWLGTVEALAVLAGRNAQRAHEGTTH